LIFREEQRKEELNRTTTTWRMCGWSSFLNQERKAKQEAKHIEHVTFALMSIVHNFFKPHNYNEAKRCDEWEKAMKAEFDALMRNNTLLLEDLPLGKKPICYKWVYMTKNIIDGLLEKHKQVWLPKVLPIKREWMMKKYLL